MQVTISQGSATVFYTSDNHGSGITEQVIAAGSGRLTFESLYPMYDLYRCLAYLFGELKIEMPT